MANRKCVTLTSVLLIWLNENVGKSVWSDGALLLNAVDNDGADGAHGA